MEANDFNDNFTTPDWSVNHDGGATAQVPTTDRLTPPPPPKTAK